MILCPIYKDEAAERRQTIAHILADRIPVTAKFPDISSKSGCCKPEIAKQYRQPACFHRQSGSSSALFSPMHFKAAIVKNLFPGIRKEKF